jgi:hypothetical protein
MIVHETSDDYAATVGAANRRLRQTSAGPPGDPERAAEILVGIAQRRDIPPNLALGVNAVEFSIDLDERMLANDRKWQEVGRSADSSEPYPTDFPPDN